MKDIIKEGLERIWDKGYNLGVKQAKKEILEKIEKMHILAKNNPMMKSDRINEFTEYNMAYNQALEDIKKEACLN